eukprot:scaffold22447_cov70-Phaeocystis_antarctica.AAC.8
MGCVGTGRARRPRARVPPPTPRPRRALHLCCDRADHSPPQIQARGGSASQGPKKPQPSRRRQSRRRPSRHSLVAAALQKHPWPPPPPPSLPPLRTPAAAKSCAWLGRMAPIAPGRRRQQREGASAAATGRAPGRACRGPRLSSEAARLG